MARKLTVVNSPDPRHYKNLIYWKEVDPKFRRFYAQLEEKLGGFGLGIILICDATHGPAPYQDAFSAPSYSLKIYVRKMERRLSTFYFLRPVGEAVALYVFVMDPGRRHTVYGLRYRETVTFTEDFEKEIGYPLGKDVLRFAVKEKLNVPPIFFKRYRTKRIGRGKKFFAHPIPED